MEKRIAIIGYSGLIGKNLLNQFKKNYQNIDLFNSKNISKISKKINYNKVFCAALPAEKWKANKYPNKDKKNTLKLINNVKNLNTNQFILISTIDINFDHPYGKNRKNFEKFVKKNFSNYLIIRLPAVFGEGLKKNIIFDLMNKNELNKIYYNDKFQWFDLSSLKKKINSITKTRKKIFEFYSEPIMNKEIIKLFKLEHEFKKRDKPVIYNFKPIDGYDSNKKLIIKALKKFIKKNEN